MKKALVLHGASDYHDVKALCEKFGIELPQEYR